VPSPRGRQDWDEDEEYCAVDEELIYRSEITALSFGISDIVASLQRIETLLRGGREDGEEEN
jgi:hypothetical protein